MTRWRDVQPWAEIRRTSDDRWCVTLHYETATAAFQTTDLGEALLTVPPWWPILIDPGASAP